MVRKSARNPVNSFCLNESRSRSAHAIMGMLRKTLAMARIAPRTGAHDTPMVEEPRTESTMPATAAMTVAATESSAVRDGLRDHQRKVGQRLRRGDEVLKHPDKRRGHRAQGVGEAEVADHRAELERHHDRDHAIRVRSCRRRNQVRSTARARPVPAAGAAGAAALTGTSCNGLGGKRPGGDSGRCGFGHLDGNIDHGLGIALVDAADDGGGRLLRRALEDFSPARRPMMRSENSSAKSTWWRFTMHVMPRSRVRRCSVSITMRELLGRGSR